MYVFQFLRTVLNPSMPFIMRIMGAPGADSASAIFASGPKKMGSNADWTMYDRIICPLNPSGKKFLLNSKLICSFNSPHLGFETVWFSPDDRKMITASRDSSHGELLRGLNAILGFFGYSLQPLSIALSAQIKRDLVLSCTNFHGKAFLS